MKSGPVIAVCICMVLLACGRNYSQNKTEEQEAALAENEGRTEIIDPGGITLENRIQPPPGFQRINAARHSFAAYLRRLPLKSHGARVKLFNGAEKSNNVHVAVVDLPIGKKDLHQCADAVIRLWAEYLYSREMYNRIHFNFTNGFRVDYAEWMKGKRISVDGSRVRWTQKTEPSNTPQDFWRYLETIFTYAGTLSLAKELNPAPVEELQPGDVFIQGGSPGHAVIVADLAVNPETGQKLFLLAQSYMPAQEIQILKNVTNDALSPWYSVDFGDKLSTPEWTFYKTDLKRFSE